MNICHNLNNKIRNIKDSKDYFILNAMASQRLENMNDSINGKVIYIE